MNSSDPSLWMPNGFLSSLFSPRPLTLWSSFLLFLSVPEPCFLTSRADHFGLHFQQLSLSGKTQPPIRDCLPIISQTVVFLDGHSTVRSLATLGTSFLVTCSPEPKRLRFHLGGAPLLGMLINWRLWRSATCGPHSHSCTVRVHLPRFRGLWGALSLGSVFLAVDVSDFFFYYFCRPLVFIGTLKDYTATLISSYSQCFTTNSKTQWERLNELFVDIQMLREETLLKYRLFHPRPISGVHLPKAGPFTP